jgi:hypothetical protein
MADECVMLKTIEAEGIHFRLGTIYIWTTIMITPVKPSTACFNILKLCILPTECVCVLCMALTINSDGIPKQH